jgi:uncharacterized protein (TIGR02284 family)
MSIFGSIKDAIFGKAKAAPAAAPARPVPVPAGAAPQAAPAPAPTAAPAPAAPVDVEAILTDLAAKSGRPSNWRTSIVDLMTLLGLDSSRQNRTDLARELGYTGDVSGQRDHEHLVAQAGHAQARREWRQGARQPRRLTSAFRNARPARNQAAAGVVADIVLTPAEKDHIMAANAHDISTLNSLIATTIDSIDGYAESAKDIESTRFGKIFTQRAAERREVVTKLKAEVTRLGGKAEDDGTLLAAAHRRFVDLKSIVTGQDDKAIIDEVERGEDHIKEKFEAAIADTELSGAARNVIQQAYTSVRQGHDQIRDIKKSMEASA